MISPLKQFEEEVASNILALGKNQKARECALNFILSTLSQKYSYNFRWLGRPIIQYPQDIVALQEVIWKVKPDLIVETGVAHGGGVIFYASMLELLGRGKVVGVDIKIRSHNLRAIYAHPFSGRIVLIKGSSTDTEVLKKIEKIVSRHKKIMVVLDSLHTHEHVLKELEAYSKFVSRGSYLVVFDTIIEYLPKGIFIGKGWDKGNNPATAVCEFLKKNKRFVADKSIEQKLVISVAPGGYLKRIR